MISRFFIERPVLSNVIALVFVLIGLVSLIQLPSAQYPNVVPPTIQVTTRYPGASAKTLIDTVALPIEQQVNGVEDMIYMQSTSADDGTYTLVVTFAIGTDPDKAQILVQNQVAAAISSLPQEVQIQGVTTSKKSTSILEFVTLVSPDSRFDSLFLTNYAVISVENELARLNGIGSVQVLGAGQYAMRIWMNPDLLQARSLTPQNVINVIQQQSQEVAAGQVGAPPAPKGQDFQYTLNLKGRLDDPAEIGNIVVKVNSTNGGQITRIRDIGRVELGAQTYSQSFSLDGRPAAGIAISLLPNANAIAVADAVKAKMDQLAKSFPPGLSYLTPYDTTKFVRASINEVYRTLIEAGILVLIVILVFLQDWRAMLVPATTVPVTIIGAFAAMAALGFTINLSTLFAIVLAIGIVVDDAIVIVEGVSRYVEQGMPGRQAAEKAMDELIGPVIGITLVLMAVFIPAAFLPGLTGQLYRQFALVIAATAFISAINAATLKPTQCALWLRPPTPLEKRNFFYRGFNAVYGLAERGYVRLIGAMTRRSGAMVILALILVGIAIWALTRVPTAFLPNEDQGYLIVAAQLPDGASKERTDAVLQRISTIARNIPGVDHVVTVSGVSILDNLATLANAGVAFVVLNDWDARLKEKGQDLLSIDLRLNGALQGVPEAIAFALPPPPIQGIGNVSGFSMQVEIRNGDFDYALLQTLAGGVVSDGNAQSSLQRLATTFRADAPQLDVIVDRIKAETLGITVGNVFSALSSYVGSTYAAQFNKFGHVFQVYTQALPDYRASAEQHRQPQGRRGERNHDADRNGDRRQKGPGSAADQPLQSLSIGYGRRQSGQRLQLGSGARHHGTDRRAGPAGRNGLRMDRNVLSGKAGRLANLLRFRPRAVARLFRIGWAIRELDPAARGSPRGAAGSDRNGRRADLCRRGQQSLYADRPHPSDRARQQECDPHCRIRARAASRGRGHSACGVRGGAAQVPAHYHDVFRLHPRRGPARGRDGRGRCGAQIDRHRGLQRHDRLDLPCGSVRSLVLCRAAALRGAQEARRRDRGARPAGARERRSFVDIINLRKIDARGRALWSAHW